MHLGHARKKSTSFEHYAKKLMDLQKGASKWSEGDNKLLMRDNDGLIVYFSKYDVTKINTGMVTVQLGDARRGQTCNELRAN